MLCFLNWVLHCLLGRPKVPRFKKFCCKKGEVQYGCSQKKTSFSIPLSSGRVTWTVWVKQLRVSDLPAFESPGTGWTQSRGPERNMQVKKEESPQIRCWDPHSRHTISDS